MKLLTIEFLENASGCDHTLCLADIHLFFRTTWQIWFFAVVQRGCNKTHEWMIKLCFIESFTACAWGHVEDLHDYLLGDCRSYARRNTWLSSLVPAPLVYDGSLTNVVLLLSRKAATSLGGMNLEPSFIFLKAFQSVYETKLRSCSYCFDDPFWKPARIYAIVVAICVQGDV